MDFAQKIKEYRQQNQWTQQTVAEKLNVSRKTISSWENGRSYPDMSMLVQISDLYHVSLDNLLREDHAMINSYDQEHLASQKGERLFQSSYLFNAVMALLSVLSLASFWQQLVDKSSFFGGALGVLMLANIFILSAHADWSKLTHQTGFWLTWAIIAVLRLAITFNHKVSLLGNYHNMTGYVTGMIVGSIIAAFSFTCIIWLYPQFKKRRN